MEFSEPLVSVLIPLYNGVEFLEDCLKSVQAQTFQSWELIVGINGHGPDGGKVASQALDCLARLGDARMRVVVQGPPLKGKVESLNALLSKTKGQWIALLDCDDLWLATKLESQVSALFSEGVDADIVGTGCTYFGHHQGFPQLPVGWITSHHLMVANPLINSSALIRTEICKKLQWQYPYTDQTVLEDYDFWMRAERAGYRLFNLEHRLVLHRIHPASAFNTQVQDIRPLQHAYRHALGL